MRRGPWMRRGRRMRRGLAAARGRSVTRLCRRRPLEARGRLGGGGASRHRGLDDGWQQQQIGGGLT